MLICYYWESLIDAGASGLAHDPIVTVINGGCRVSTSLQNIFHGDLHKFQKIYQNYSCKMIKKKTLLRQQPI